MISKFQIFSMIVSILLVIAIPIYIFRRYRGNYKMSQGIIWGMLAYFIYTITRIVLLTVITQIFPGLDYENMGGNAFVTALTEGVLNAISFAVAASIVYRYQLRKMEDDEIPILNGLTFVMVSAMFLIMPLINYTMFSIKANGGNLESFVNDQVTLEQVEQIALAIKNTPSVMFLDMGLARIFDIFVYVAGFIAVYFGYVYYPEEKIKYIFVGALIVFGYFTISVLSLGVFAVYPIVTIVLKAIYAIAIFKVTYGYQTQLLGQSVSE